MARDDSEASLRAAVARAEAAPPQPREPEVVAHVLPKGAGVPCSLPKAAPLTAAQSAVKGTTNYRQVSTSKLVSNQPTGGLKFTDDAELQTQRALAWQLVKDVGNSLMEGRELVNITLPIQLFEPRSFLERLTDGWAFAPDYLAAAARATDPLERFKQVIAFVVSGIHLTPTHQKPFNPILGETYEAYFDDGTLVCCEQSSHHPPASNWQVIPPDGSYHFWGHGIWSAACRGNILKGYQKGPCVVDFADGTRITYTVPTLVVRGIFWGERIFDFCDSLKFVDEKSGLECELSVDPEALGFIMSFFKSQKAPTDVMRGQITRAKEGGARENVCSVDGSWLSHLEFDGVKYWVRGKQPHAIYPSLTPLPSDCRFRDDLVALRAGDLEAAKDAKLALEQKQRLEARWRKEGSAVAAAASTT